MTEQQTKFDYLLNALELAAQSDKPAEHGYAEARRALFAYVRDLERCSALSEGEQGQWMPMTQSLPAAGQHVLVMSENWLQPRVLEYNYFPHRRLIDRASGWHCWYPERMHWQPLPPPPAIAAEKKEKP